MGTIINLKNLLVATTCLTVGTIQCLAQEPGNEGDIEDGFGRLAAFRTSANVPELHFDGPAEFPYANAAISDSVEGVAGNPASSEYGLSPSTTIQPWYSGSSRFESLNSFRTVSGYDASGQSNLPAPLQFSDLGRFRTASNALPSDQDASAPPMPEVDGQFVSAAPASSFLATDQDQAPSSVGPNFHQDLLQGQFGSQIEQRLRNSSCMREYGSNTTPTHSLEQSELVLTANAKTWVTPDLFWKPLYFEDAAAERYGHHAGIFQPSVSACRFLVDTAFLPYKFSAHPPRECEFGLGYDRPGNCVEPRFRRPELSGRGLLGQGAAVTGLIFLF